MVSSNRTAGDHRILHAFCRDLFTLDDVDEVRRESLLFFERHLGAEKGNFFMAESPDKPVSFMRIVQRGIDNGALHHYRRYYWRIDPFYRIFASQKPHGVLDVLTTEDIVPFRELTRTEYYNDFLRPQSIHHQMTIHLKSDKQVLGVVALFRSRRARGFSARDKSRALAAAPFLSGALKGALASEKSRALESVLPAILREKPWEGLVVLDRFLNPVYTDGQAERLLSGLKADGEGATSLQKAVSGPCKKMLAARERHTGPLEREGRVDLGSDGPGPRIRLRLRLADDPESGPLFLLFLEGEERVARLEGILRDRGLTRREVEVVQVLARGARNAEIAEKLFISEHTVENHLRSIYRKLGVSNRTAAVHRLLQRPEPGSVH
jgi:DNA-binding CsgD family transcriptional regulator